MPSRKQVRVKERQRRANNSATLYAPTLDGHNHDKLRFFRMDQTKEKGDKARYPLGRLPVRSFISFGKERNTENYPLRLNSNRAVNTSFNKVATKEILRRLSIPVAHHVQALDFSSVDDDGGYSISITPLIHSLSGFPIIMKPVEGEAGQGVTIINNINELIDFIEQDEFFGDNLENYIVEDYFSHHSELRFHVSPWIDTFIAPNGEKFTNGVFTIQKFLRPDKQDLAGEKVEFTTRHNLSDEKKAELSKIAAKAIAGVGLDFGAVDFLVGDDGFIVGEINSNPYMNLDGDYHNPGYIVKVYRQALAKMLVEKAIERGLMDAQKSASAINTTNNMKVKVKRCVE